MGILNNIPFTYHWLIRKSIRNDTQSILDLGCGDGVFMKYVSEGEKWNITGVELFDHAVHLARISGTYTKVVKADVTKLPKSLLNKKFDLVFASQVLEHLSKEMGRSSIKVWEKLATKQVVVSTPVGFIDFNPVGRHVTRDINPLQKHNSGWTPREFRKMGYHVIGQGAKFIYGEQGLARKYPSLLPVFSLISYLVSPIIFFLPSRATYMICVKQVSR